ncbi:MAG: abortive infection family protein [Myxococcales bacterium]|nr:abortive infection family protein [Myxococcales bacterium]
MPKPTINALELKAMDAVFEMRGGFLLDFSDADYALFLEDLGITVVREPGISKAKHLRAFIRSAEPSLAARLLEGLLAHRRERDHDDELVEEFATIRRAIERLRSSGLTLATPGPHVLTSDYAKELDEGIRERLAAGNFSGAISLARTFLENVLIELRRELVATPKPHKGDLMVLYKDVSKALGIDDQREDLDEHFKTVARGLSQVVHGLAPIRNEMSDAHPRTRAPAAHHARFVVNAAKTVATFLIESHAFQRDKGRLPNPPV